MPRSDLADIVLERLTAAYRSASGPRRAAAMDAWITDGGPWVVRTALLHQLSHKERTDADRLFAHCLLCSSA
ncbi:DNA alkylation repair protein [Streptomyces sp. NPDC014636]|uniref:DNA alkylation repair protein n=1 Tax=Streptomyces sp. NPDC014636 TaxID=3364876 RepID=UPI0036FA822B